LAKNRGRCQQRPSKNVATSRGLQQNQTFKSQGYYAFGVLLRSALMKLP